MNDAELLNLGLVHPIHTTERRSFRGCRRRWAWVFRDMYYPLITARPLEFGVAYHAAMEKWYDPLLWGHEDHKDVGKRLAILEFQRIVNNQLKDYKRLNGELSPEAKEDYRDRVDLGIKMITYYLDKISPLVDVGFKPIGVEVPFEVPLGFRCNCAYCWKKWLSYWNSHSAEYQRLSLHTRTTSASRKTWEGLPVTYGGRIDMIALDEHDRVWIFDWKRLTLGTWLPTPNGWKTMEEIKVGDFVFGANGKPTEVLGEKTWEPDTVYEVVFSDGTIVNCSGDHLWQVYNNHSGIYSVQTTEQIMNKPKYVGYSVDPIGGPVEFDPFEAMLQCDLPMHPYVLGSLLGDGCFTGSVLTYASQSGETIELLKQYADPDVSFKDQRGQGANKWQIDGPWRDVLKSMGLWGKYAGEKWIPPDYKYASVEDRILLLQGLCDTDGNTGLLRWTTTSSQLAKDFRHLVWSLGGTADMSVSKERVHQNGITINVPQYNVNYTFSTNIEPNQLERKRVGRIERKRKTRRRIKEVRKTDRQEPMKCIYVASPDHLFATENFVLTHNTTARILDETSEAAFLELDDQITSYVTALWKLGRPVAGFVYHEQRKAVPEPPKALIRRMGGRSFSTAKNANTDYQTFMKTIFEEDHEAFALGYYDDYLKWLKEEGPRYWQRHQITRNPTELANAWDNILAEAHDIIDNPRVYPQPGRFSCPTCAYRQPCLGKNQGEDYQYLLDTMFEKRQKHYFEDVMTTD